jgi:carbon monoxide dehydrogenase subunit G
MLKILGLVVGALAVLVAVLVAYATTRPDTFRVARSTTIKAPPGRIFPLIADFHRWTAWSPYETLDPDLKRTYGGAPLGVGATYAWSGKKAGDGRMEIVEAPAPSQVVIKLDFSKPMVAHNIAKFSLEPDGGNTKVTWAMEGPQPLIAKVMGLVFSMDSLVGKDFETGLANMKAAAEQ